MTGSFARSIALVALAAGAGWAQVTINTTSPLPTATIGTLYNQTLSASGGTTLPYQWAVTAGSLPDGLTLTTDGTITGTPLSTAVTETFTVQVADSAVPPNTSAPAQFTLPVLTITTPSPLPTGTVSIAYSQPLTAVGGSGQYTWSVSVGSLPDGLTLNSATGAIGGQPTTAGQTNFTIQVTDTNQGTATQAYTMTIDPPLAIMTQSPLPAGTVGVSYSKTLVATGGSGTYTWAVSAGSLPGGLTLNAVSGLIHGQPMTAEQANFTIQVTDTNQVAASMPFVLTIDPALVITTASPLPAGAIGENYSQTLAATGGSGTYTWSVSVGSLPGGLTLNSATGAITSIIGGPTTAATSNFTIQVTDTNTAMTSKAFALTINPALAITTNSTLPPATVGANYSLTLAATGGVGSYTWAVSTGSLPGGLTLTAATGVISGQPATAGQANFTIQVTDGNQANATLPVTLTIDPALVITTSSPLPNGAVGENYSQTMAATGGSGQYAWSVSVGALPGGLTLNSATGAITGQPATNATSNFTILVTDTDNVTATKALALTINPALAITTNSTLPAGTVGANYSQTLAATGGVGTYTWSVSAGSLPGGLTLNPATGAISGIPGTNATTNFTIQVTDSNQGKATAQFSLTVNPALTITTTSPLANGVINGTYNQTLAGSGGSLPYTWSLASGSLPNGLTLTSSSTTGTIGGTPTAIGAFSFVIQLSDSTTPVNTVTKKFVITIAPFSITTPPTLANATVGVPYSLTLAAAGGVPPYVSWAVTKGSLPAPLSLNSSTGQITGTPTSTASGATFTVTVTDSANNTASQAFTLTVVNPPVITTTSLPNGNAGAQYSQTLAASNGTPPYQWTVLSGSLPTGLSLSATVGAITGKPSAAGPFTFTVQLKDATGVTANSQPFTITIVAGLTVSTTSPLPTGEATIAYTQKLAATGGTSPYTWSVTGGALPGGVTLSASGSFTGTPSATGTFSFTVQVTDNNSLTASAQLAVTIAPAVGISTPGALNGGSLNASYSQSLTASAGVSPYTWSLTAGSLPQGLTLSTAGTVAGIPKATGTFLFTAMVTDSLGATASRQFTIVIATGLTIATPPTLPGASVGVPYNESLEAAGGTPPYTWFNTSGLLPGGVSLGSNGSLTGIPNAAGSFSFTVQVKDSQGRLASELLSITVAPALSITTSTLPGGTVGAAYSQSLAAAGGTPPYTWSLVSGSLPGGLTLSSGGSIGGSANAVGTFSFTVKVADSAALSATKQLSIDVAGGLSITTAAALPNAFISTTYSQTLTVTGGTQPFTWALTTSADSLPPGVTLNGAVLSGTPTKTGSYTFTIQVTDTAGGTASQQFTLIVGGGLTITITTLPSGKVGATYSQTLTAAGGIPPYAFATSAGSLPPGITLSGAVLGGTPTKTGSYTFTIQVTDSVAATATQQFSIIVIGGVVITTSALPGAAVGTAYSQTLSAAGTAPYTWAIAQGALPGGLTLDASSGTISGTPTAAGSSSVTIQVTDSTKATASAAFTLTVISGSFTGLSSTAASAQQLSGALALGAAFPQEITGQVTLAFQPDTSLTSPADDPAIQFSAGGRAMNFTIPANSTAPKSFSLQTGTVAGTITLTVTWQAGGAALATPAALTQTIQIARAVPEISSVTATTTSSGFQVVITGYSNTRDVSQAVLQFTPASGQTLQTTSLTESLGGAAGAATTWFQSSTSDQYGSQFTLTLPFTVSNGSAGAIASVSVELVNSQGNSNSASSGL